jgi:N-methylhydantoinase A
MSAAGFLAAPMRYDTVRSAPGPLEALDWAAARAAVAEMEAEACAVLGRVLPEDAIRLTRVADMRYRKQGYELRTPVPEGALAPALAEPLRAAFEETYAALYGHTVPGAEVDVVSWRVIAEGPQPELAFGAGHAARGEPAKGARRAWLPEEGRFAEIPVLDRYALAPGAELGGPCIVEERESTVVINAPARLRLDEAANLIAEPA